MGTIIWAYCGIDDANGWLISLTACGVGAYFVAGNMSLEQGKWLKAMEQRIDATKRLCDSLKAVKMRGAETRVSRVVNELRRLEIQAARPFRALITASVILCQ